MRKTSVYLTLKCILLISMILFYTISVFASNNGSGKCGDTVYWKLDNSGNLKITGNGEMYESDGTTAIGKQYASLVKSIIFSGKITFISQHAFNGFKNVNNVTLPSSNVYIGAYAFKNCISLSKLTIPKNCKVSVGWESFDGCKNITVYGYSDTNAESFAKQEGFIFKALDRSVSLDKNKITIKKGSKVTLKAKKINVSGTIKWKSSDKSIASVNRKGKVTAKKAGTVIITAYVGKYKATCKVIVKD